jgi:glutathione S-transferase
MPMRALYHFPVHAGCRQVRLALAEKGLEFELRMEPIWQRRESFLRMNPAGDVPVLVEADGTVVTGGSVIAEYLEEVYPRPSLLPGDPIDRAEIRRLVTWFDSKFHREVTENLADEKIASRFMRKGQPDSTAIRAGHANIHYHLDYIGWLYHRRNWLAGDEFSLADIAAAAELSCVDYLGDVPWEERAEAKNWYARIKSRPSMRSILADTLPGFPPPASYPDPDF